MAAASSQGLNGHERPLATSSLARCLALSVSSALGAVGAKKGQQKKHKPSKAELLEAAKAKQEALKALEGTKEGRVRA